MPANDGAGSGDTSPAGSCDAAFGDTDRTYEPASSQWVVTFAYPMGGEVSFTGSGGDEIAAAIGYVPGGDGGYAHELIRTVVEYYRQTPTPGSALTGRLLQRSV